MNRFKIVSIFIPFLIVFSLITASNSNAGVPVPDFTIGPNGDAFKLVDCSIGGINGNTALCDNNAGGAIDWTRSRIKAQDMTFEGFACDLATPSTEEVNDFLKSFPGFVEACNQCDTIPDLQVCAWFGGMDPIEDDENGPYRFVNDPINNIPCEGGGIPNACNPMVMPGVGTALTFQDWCRVENDCADDEPNFAVELYMNYIRWTIGNTGVGWNDCTENCTVGDNCPPTSSYFVQCDLPDKVVSPIPTLSEWGLIAMAGVLGIIGFIVIRRRKVTV